MPLSRVRILHSPLRLCFALARVERGIQATNARLRGLALGDESLAGQPKLASWWDAPLGMRPAAASPCHHHRRGELTVTPRADRAKIHATDLDRATHSSAKRFWKLR